MKFAALPWLLFIFSCLGLNSASGQLLSECNVIPEAIYRFGPSDLGASILWSRDFGRKDYTETFVAGMPAKDNNFMMVTRALGYTENDKAWIFKTISTHGRFLSDHSHELPGVIDIIALLPTDDGFHAFGTQSKVFEKSKPETKRIWIGRFDQEGKFLSDKTIGDTTADLTVTTAKKEGDQFILAATVDQKSLVQPKHSRIYFLDKNLRIKGQNSFVLGFENAVHDVVPLGPERYAGIGYQVTAAGNRAGWITAFGNNIGMDWQRAWARGSNAEFRSAALFPNGDLAVIGTVNPARGSDAKKAAWLAYVEQGTGDLIWQRYFTQESDLSGIHVRADTENQMLVALIGAENSGQEIDENNEKTLVNQAHAKLVNISIRGETLTTESYFHGDGLTPLDMFVVDGNDQVVFGHTRINYEPNSEEEDLSELSFSRNPWMMVSPQTFLYEDPCIQ